LDCEGGKIAGRWSGVDGVEDSMGLSSASATDGNADRLSERIAPRDGIRCEMPGFLAQSNSIGNSPRIPWTAVSIFVQK
jgi:hypothetical protein